MQVDRFCKYAPRLGWEQENLIYKIIEDLDTMEQDLWAALNQ